LSTTNSKKNESPTIFQHREQEKKKVGDVSNAEIRKILPGYLQQSPARSSGLSGSQAQLVLGAIVRAALNESVEDFPCHQ